MAAPRYRPHKDGNHAEVVTRFGEYGASVFDAASVGDGFPDLVVGLCRQNFLVEVKDGSRPPSDRKLRPSQKKFKAGWLGYPVQVVETLDDVDALCQAVHAQHARRSDD